MWSLWTTNRNWTIGVHRTIRLKSGEEEMLWRVIFQCIYHLFFVVVVEYAWMYWWRAIHSQHAIGLAMYWMQRYRLVRCCARECECFCLPLHDIWNYEECFEPHKHKPMRECDGKRVVVVCSLHMTVGQFSFECVCTCRIRASPQKRYTVRSSADRSFSMPSTFFSLLHFLCSDIETKFERSHSPNANETTRIACEYLSIIDIVWDLTRELVFINEGETINCLLIGQARGLRRRKQCAKKKTNNIFSWSLGVSILTPNAQCVTRVERRKAKRRRFIVLTWIDLIDAWFIFIVIFSGLYVVLYITR